MNHRVAGSDDITLQSVVDYLTTNKCRRKHYSEISFLFEPVFDTLMASKILKSNYRMMIDNNKEAIFGHAQLLVADSAILYLNNRFNKERRFVNFTDFLENCLKESNRESVLEDFYSLFPELFRLVVTYFTKMILNFITVMDIVEENYVAIRNIYGVGELVNLKMNGGDRHKECKSTVLLEFNNKNLYLKWKSIDFEEKVHMIRDKLYNNKVTKIKSLRGDGWYIQEELVQLPTNCLKEFYVNSGKLLFLSYVLGISDLHEENIIVSGNDVYIIDSETVFEVDSFLKDDIQEYDLGNSVYSTGLLPFRSFFGAIISGFNSRKEQIMYREDYSIKITSKGLIKNKISNKKMKTLKNKPTNIELDFYGNSDLVIRGFQKMYEYFLKNKFELVSYIEKIFNRTETRTLIKNTHDYYLELNNSYHPYLMMDNEKRKEYIMQLKNFNTEEKKFLIDDEIPYFTKKLIISPSFWHKFNSKDLELQKKLIKKSFQAESSYFSEFKQDPIPKSQAIHAYIDFLIENQLKIDNKILWLDEVYVGTDQYTDYNLILSPDNIYMGKSGILLLLNKYLYNFSSEKLANFSDSLFFNQLEKVRYTILNYPKSLCGMLDGTSGMVYSLYVANKRKRIISESVIIELLKKIVNNIEYDTKFDIVSGSAGLLKVLCEIYNSTDGSNEAKNVLFDLIESVESYLINNYSVKDIGWRTDDSNEFYFGYAHGSSGIASSLYSSYLITNRSEALIVVKCVVNNLLNEYSMELDSNWTISKGKKENCFNWCHGSPGIILFFSELNERGYENNKLKEIVRICLNKILNSDKKDVCLCHGRYGNYIIAKKAMKTFNLEEFNVRLKKELADIQKFIYTEANFNKFPKSFMTGLVGIFYYELEMNK